MPCSEVAKRKRVPRGIWGPSAGGERVLPALGKLATSGPSRAHAGEGFRALGLALGKGASPLEVVVTNATGQPTVGLLQRAWKKRHGGRAVPVLLVTLYADQAAICRLAGDEPPAYVNLDRGLVERLCSTALAEPDRHAALRFLCGALPEIESPLPGLRNKGLLSTHELEYGVPRRSDWQRAAAGAVSAHTARGEDPLRALGFEIEHMPGQASMLLVRGTRTAVAVLLHRSEPPDVAADRFSGLSPVSYALHQADQQRVPYVVVTEKPMLRLYPVETGVGVGRRGRTETFVEVHLDPLQCPVERVHSSRMVRNRETTRAGVPEGVAQLARRFISLTLTIHASSLLGPPVPRTA